MFVVAGLVVLLVFMVGRPFDFLPALRGIPLLYLFCAIAILGYAMDLRLRLVEFRSAPHAKWAVAFVVWALLTALIRAPGSLVKAAIELAIPLTLYLLIALGVQSFKAFEVVTATLMFCVLWVAFVCVHQGLQPRQCIEFWPGETRMDLGHPTGQPCEFRAQCADGQRCENVGLFGTTSTDNRVRYVGILQDSNEVAMVVSASLPFAFAFFARRKNRRRLLFAAVMAAFTLSTVRFSQSRGGLLVVGVVLLSYALQRFGLKRMLVFGIPTAMVLATVLLGGAERDDAAQSTLERLMCQSAAIDMLTSWPLFGVGFEQFTQHHAQTAHNSLLLAAGELGVLGVLLWSTLVYLSIKTFLVGATTCNSEAAQVARIWGRALATSLISMCVGMFFLSFTYHNILWIYLALSAAYFSAIVRHDRTWRVKLGWRDGVVILALNTLLIGGMAIYTTIEL